MNVFYEIKDKTLIIFLLREAVKLSFDYHVDILPEGKFARKRVDKDIEEVIDNINVNKDYFTFVVRKFDFFQDKKDPKTGRESYIETGTKDDKYYTFIYVDIGYLQHFILKYKLKEKNWV